MAFASFWPSAAEAAPARSRNPEAAIASVLSIFFIFFPKSLSWRQRLFLRQHRIRDGRRQGLRAFQQPEQGQDHNEVQEVVSRENARPENIGPFRRLGSQIAQGHADNHEYPEELLEDWPVGARPHPRRIKPGQEEEDQD